MFSASDRDHLRLISGSLRQTFKNQMMKSLFKTSFNLSIFKRLNTGISTKCNKCHKCNRTREAICIKTWETATEGESTTTEAIEEETEVAEVEVVNTIKTIKAARTSTSAEETKDTITTRDKIWGNQACHNHNNNQDKLTNSKCNSSSQQHHKCR